MAFVAIGGIAHHNVMAGLGVEGQCTAAADFDVVGMRADGEDAQLFGHDNSFEGELSIVDGQLSIVNGSNLGEFLQVANPLTIER